MPLRELVATIGHDSFNRHLRSGTDHVPWAIGVVRVHGRATPCLFADSARCGNEGCLAARAGVRGLPVPYRRRGQRAAS